MQVHRFQNPFRHWVSGLAFEIAMIGAFLLLVAGVVVVLVRGL